MDPAPVVSDADPGRNCEAGDSYMTPHGARYVAGYTYIPKTGLILEGRQYGGIRTWPHERPAARAVPAGEIRPGSTPEKNVTISCNGADVPVLDILDGSAPAGGCGFGRTELEIMLLLQAVPALPLSYMHDMFDIAPLGGIREEYRPRQAYRAYGAGEAATPDYRVRFEAGTYGIDVPLPPGTRRHMYEYPSVIGRIHGARMAEHGRALLSALDAAEYAGPAGTSCTAENGRPYLGITTGELDGIISGKIRSSGDIFVLAGIETCYQYMRGCGRGHEILRAYPGGCPMPGMPNATIIPSPMVDNHAPGSIYVVNRQYGALYGQGPVFIGVGAGGLRVEESFEYVMVDGHIRRYGALPEGPTALRIDAGRTR
ncbi:MAG: hypothetical protein MPI93_04120 [Nitrosopumilus sp.]|nr:hypothetical protein [Nitrosopumilus sp.]